MKINYNTTGPKRKELVQLIARFTGNEIKYCGAPTFAYEIGGYSVDKNGTVTADPNAADETVERLMQMLYDNGFSGECEDAPEPEAAADGFSVSLPMDGFTDLALENLRKLLDAKGALIQKALGADRLTVETTEDRVSFPWWDHLPEHEDVQAYMSFITALCAMAKEAKRVTAKEKDTDNEKYAFRCFLLRLGFIGAESKTNRKVLLRNLTGSSAFKSGARKEAATEGDSAPVSAPGEEVGEQCE